MEKLPNYESDKSPEDAAAEILKEKGPQSEEFLNWITESERKVDNINTSRASLDLSTQLARIYYKAGFIKEAVDSLYDNREAALSEGEEVLADIDSLLDRMEAGEEI